MPEIAARALLGVANVLEITVRSSLGVLSAHRSKSQTKSLFEVTSLCLSTRLHFTRLQHCSVHVYARVHTSIYIYIYIYVYTSVYPFIYMHGAMLELGEVQPSREAQRRDFEE